MKPNNKANNKVTFCKLNSKIFIIFERKKATIFDAL